VLSVCLSAQKYIKKHGPAPTATIDEPAPTTDHVAFWDGKAQLAPYEQLKLTQTYRCFLQTCTVVGCTLPIDAPTYVMELVGAPVCMECGQKIAMQQLKGKSDKPFEYAFEKPTEEDIRKAQEAGIKLPAWIKIS